MGSKTRGTYHMYDPSPRTLKVELEAHELNETQDTYQLRHLAASAVETEIRDLGFIKV